MADSPSQVAFSLAGTLYHPVLISTKRSALCRMARVKKFRKEVESRIRLV